MNFKQICLTGAAIIALGAGTVAAQARSTAEEDAITRQLNLDQLNKTQSSGANTMQATPAPAPDGQGGPEFQGPPKPDEGMTDEDTKGDDKTKTDDGYVDDENGPPPPEDKPPVPEPKPD